MSFSMSYNPFATGKTTFSGGRGFQGSTAVSGHFGASNAVNAGGGAAAPVPGGNPTPRGGQTTLGGSPAGMSLFSQLVHMFGKQGQPGQPKALPRAAGGIAPGFNLGLAPGAPLQHGLPLVSQSAFFGQVHSPGQYGYGGSDFNFHKALRSYGQSPTAQAMLNPARALYGV